MIEHSENITTLACGLVGAQGIAGGAKRDAKNPHFKRNYATLESVIDVAKPALQANGIAFLQSPGQIIDGAVELTTMLIHGESGQWIRSTLHVPIPKRDPQGVGSAITYGCRYALMAFLGIPPTDDDGEAAMDRDGKPLNLPKAKSSAALKRDGFWPEFESELSECDTIFKLNKFAASWGATADKDDWNDAFRAAAKDKVAYQRQFILENARVSDDDPFPGGIKNGKPNLHMAG